MDTNNLKNDFKDGLNKTENAVGLTSNEEPTTGHDAKEGGIMGAVGGAVVGMLAGGPVGAVIGAIAGGAASAAAVNAVDKHDNDYNRTNAATTDTQPYSTTPTVDDDFADTDTLGTNNSATGYTGPGDYQRTQTAPDVGTYAAPATASVAAPSAYNDAALSSQINNDDTDRTIQLREEQLSATKQPVQTGEVTLRKEVITETRSIDVPVTREEVVIERHAVSGAAPAGSFDTTEEVIRVPVMEEQVTIQKTPVVTEEISLGKRQVTETQHFTDTVRHEEARIENPGSVDVLQNGAIGAEVDEDESSLNASRPASSSY